MRLNPAPHWRLDDVELFLLTPDKVTDAYVSWLNDPAISRFLESRFVRHDKQAVETFVTGLLASPNDVFFGIHSHALDRHVGNIKIGPINRLHGLGEIGIMIGDIDAWGLGIGSRAISIISTIAREQLALRKLSAGCYATNVGSEKAFVRAGFTVEGRRPAHYVLDDQPEDLILMGKIL